MNISKTRHKLYPTYNGMVQRCYNPNATSYYKYGALGIKICDAWLGETGFQTFLLDMGDKPIGYQLDRIDSTLGYSPENCRWVTTGHQAANRRNFKTSEVPYKGVTKKIRKDGSIRYRAKFTFEGVEYSLGMFETPEDAARAYDTEAKEWYKEHALLNFPVDYDLKDKK